jgi:hypothetical protein
MSVLRSALVTVLMAVMALLPSNIQGEPTEDEERVKQVEAAHRESRGKNKADPRGRYRQAALDPWVRKVPRDIQSGIRTDPVAFVPKLVQFLVKGATDEFHIVKRLHDWIADNIAYDTESYFSGNIGSLGGYQGVLTKGSSVCSGYATVFQKLATEAGLEAVTITGFARGYSYAASGTHDTSRDNHAWNAVKIHGTYYLVDTTWDAGYVYATGNFDKTYSTGYLFIPPEAFIYSHFPRDPKWQLLDKPLLADEFGRLPLLEGNFFARGLKLLTDLKPTNEVGASTEVKLRIPSGLNVLINIVSADGKDTTGCHRFQQEGKSGSLRILFPAAGDYKVHLFTLKPEVEKKHKFATTFNFHASDGSTKRFPQTFGSYQSSGAVLLEPLYGPLSANSNVTFRIRIPGADKAAVVTAGNTWNYLIRKEGDLFEGTVSIPSEIKVSIVAGFGTQKVDWKTLAVF